VKQFRGGLAFKAHRLLYHSPLGSRVMRRDKRETEQLLGWHEQIFPSARENRTCSRGRLELPDGAETLSGSEEGSYLRLIHVGITQL